MPDTFALFGVPQFHVHLQPLEATPPELRRTLRFITIPLFAWLPLLVLSLFEGKAAYGTAVPFLFDYEVQARLLVALPLYLLAEWYCDRVVMVTLRAFIQRGLVRESDRPRYQELIESAGRWSRSPLLFVLLLGFVMIAGQLLWQRGLVTRTGTWYAEQLPEEHWTWAGYWFAWVAIPVFQFIQYRWYARLVIWWLLLWRIGRLKLQLRPTHPDLAGGLGFLGSRLYAFFPFLIAQGTTVSGLLCNQIFYEHRTLTEFWRGLLVLGAFITMMVLGPLTSFSGPLLRAMRRGKAEYTLLASRYVTEFERKWVEPDEIPVKDLVGSPDIQSLADLANGWDVVRRMRPVPFSRTAILKVAAALAAPIAPLILTVFPLEEVLLTLVKMLL